jgi:hypothetical protein
MVMNASRKAKSDPGEPSGKSGLLLIVGVAAAGLLVLCCGGGAVGTYLLRDSLGFGKGAATIEEDQKEKDKKKKKDGYYEFAATEILREYMKDPDKAERKYKNATLDISGEIFFIHGKERIDLKGVKRNPNDPGDIKIIADIAPAFHGKALRLSKDQKIKIIGKFPSYAKDSHLSVSECEIIELEPSKLLDVTAEELARAFEQDVKAAEDKYRGRDLAFTGTVETVRVGKFASSARFKGTEKTAVLAQLATAKDFQGAENRRIECRVKLEDFPYRKGNVHILVDYLLPSK